MSMFRHAPNALTSYRIDPSLDEHHRDLADRLLRGACEAINLAILTLEDGSNEDVSREERHNRAATARQFLVEAVTLLARARILIPRVRTYTIAVITTAEQSVEAELPRLHQLADRIAVMEGGILQQFATPQAIKEAPANLFTGTFVGEPPMNVFSAQASDQGGQLRLDLGDGLHLTYAADAFAPEVRATLLKRKDIMLGVRPYAVHRDTEGAQAQVIANQWLGDQSHIAATFAQGTIVLVEHDRANVAVGDAINVRLAPEDLHIFDKDTGAALSHGAHLA